MRRVATFIAVLFSFFQLAWGQSDVVGADEQVILFPTLGHRVEGRRAWVVDVHGWIFEEGVNDAALRMLEDALDLDETIRDPAERKLLRKRLRPFLVDNERGHWVEIEIGGRRVQVGPSAVNGHFQQELKLTAEEVTAAQRREAGGKQRLICKVALPARDKRSFAGRVHLLEPRGLSVISDIDDTIRVTGVNDKKALIRSTFLRPFVPVPGMAEVYSEWAGRHGAEFHYASASPYQLYTPLEEFMRAHKFPEGSFHLKPVRLKDRTLLSVFASAEDYKRARIEPILKRYPERTFVCVGDSGEKDPEVYGALAREYPQVRRILIRDVTGEGPEAPRYRQAFRDLPREMWEVFKDPAQIRELGPLVSAATRPSGPSN